MPGSAMSPVGGIPEQFNAKFRSFAARMKKVIKAYGMCIE